MGFRFFKQFLMVAGFLAVAGAAGGREVVVVDDSHGAPTYTETGTWATTTNPSSGHGGTLYRFTRDTNPTSTATWRPNFEEGGVYEVIAVFRMATDRTASAPYTIVHANGSNVVSVDQRGVFAGPLGNASLGLYQFEAGTAGSVTLANNGGAGVYIADAILFEPVEGAEFHGVSHYPLYPGPEFPVTAVARVESATGIDGVMLHWESPDPVAEGMVAADSDDGFVYTAIIPARPGGSVVTYYFEAVDDFGVVTTSDPVSYTVGATGDFQVVINEVMASNTHTNVDPDFGGAADWVEFYNFGPDTADLTGLAFSDRLNNPTKWFFPPGTTIPPGGYLLVWCDNEDMVGEAIHTSFALSASGEDAVLYDPATETVLDSISWTDLETDVSLARIPNATGDFVRTVNPTPGGPNVFEERGDPPVYSHESGLYFDEFFLSITAPGADAVRYTTNGSHPTASSALYTDPIRISSTTGVRARAFYSDKEPSQATSGSFFFSNIEDRDIPVMNVVIDPDDLFSPTTGIYTNFNERGREWEREVHVSIVSPDGMTRRNLDAGIRMHGGFSRTAPKKSFRLYFRNDYGTTELDVPWLERSPISEVSQLVLRAGGNDGFLVTDVNQRRQVTFVRDEIIRDWYRQMGHYAVDGFFVALYLNGDYWGMYNVVERITADQMDRLLPGNDDYDVVKGGWNSVQRYFTEANNGDLEAWEEFLAWHTNGDVATDPDFAEFKERVNYQNFMDFFALNIFCQNEDWPHNNWIATRHRTRSDAQWIFHQWDSEWALGLRPQGWTSNSLRWARGDNFHLSPSHNNTIAPLSNVFDGNRFHAGRTRDINGVLRHPHGQRDFIIALENVMNFFMKPEKTVGEFNAYIDLIRNEVPREAARWAPSVPENSSQLVGYFNTASENLRNFLQNRPASMRQITINEFSLAGARQLTFTAAGSGSGQLEVRGHLVDLPWSGWFFDGSPIELSAIAGHESRFSRWEGHLTGTDTDIEHVATAGVDATVVLHFEEDEDVYQPNDVIFNEYWVNDNGTFYPSINAAISRDWFELLVVRNGVDLRGWRVTTNATKRERNVAGSGSIIFPDLPVLENLPSGTIILVVSSINETNDDSFPEDELGLENHRLIFYAGNGNLDLETDPGFGIGTSDEALVLLAPGASSSFADDIGIDFIAEGYRVTPESFFETDNPPVAFYPAFEGISNDDGAIFTNDPTGGFNNDNGFDPDRTDALAGPGGWIVDPPARYTGDTDPVEMNILTPGAPNWGQDLSSLRGISGANWLLY